VCLRNESRERNEVERPDESIAIFLLAHSASVVLMGALAVLVHQTVVSVYLFLFPVRFGSAVSAGVMFVLRVVLSMRSGAAVPVHWTVVMIDRRGNSQSPYHYFALQDQVECNLHRLSH
jgi:hypothetical protein